MSSNDVQIVPIRTVSGVVGAERERLKDCEAMADESQVIVPGDSKVGRDHRAHLFLH
jgi:hypothetical protein